MCRVGATVKVDAAHSAGIDDGRNRLKVSHVIRLVKSQPVKQEQDFVFLATTNMGSGRDAATGGPGQSAGQPHDFLARNRQAISKSTIEIGMCGRFRILEPVQTRRDYDLWNWHLDSWLRKPRFRPVDVRRDNQKRAGRTFLHVEPEGPEKIRQCGDGVDTTGRQLDKHIAGDEVGRENDANALLLKP